MAVEVENDLPWNDLWGRGVHKNWVKIQPIYFMTHGNRQSDAMDNWCHVSFINDTSIDGRDSQFGDKI